MILKEGDNSEIQKFIYAKISDLPTKDKLKYKDGSEIVIEFFFNDLPFKSKSNFKWCKNRNKKSNILESIRYFKIKSVKILLQK
ncbi:hypothetical protein NW062_00035 [Mycoplasmopsis cynos]|nr:hypothetical protein NW062_00035 [Mycoplasmopsis cynos]